MTASLIIHVQLFFSELDTLWKKKHFCQSPSSEVQWVADNNHNNIITAITLTVSATGGTIRTNSHCSSLRKIIMSKWLMSGCISRNVKTWSQASSSQITQLWLNPGLKTYQQFTDTFLLFSNISSWLLWVLEKWCQTSTLKDLNMWSWLWEWKSDNEKELWMKRRWRRWSSWFNLCRAL